MSQGHVAAGTLIYEDLWTSRMCWEGLWRVVPVVPMGGPYQRGLRLVRTASLASTRGRRPTVRRDAETSRRLWAASMTSARIHLAELRGQTGVLAERLSDEG